MNSLGSHYMSGIGVKKNEIEGFKWWKNAASKGNTDSQYELYNCYILGKGTKVDPLEASIWLQKAAFEGHTRSQLKLAECFKKALKGFNKDLNDAKKWYEKAKESNENGEVTIPSFEKL